MPDIDISSDRKFKVTPEWMAEKYKVLNDWLFGGQLGECKLGVFTTGKGSRGSHYGWFFMDTNGLKCNKHDRRLFKEFYFTYPNTKRVYVTRENFATLCRPVIQMNGNYSGTEYALLSTLLHEMCHYAEFMDGRYNGASHGKEFMYWAALVSQRSGGIFSVQKVANAEEQKGYELDHKIAASNKKRADNKKAKLIAAFVFRTDGKIELTLTSHQEVLDKLYLRNTDPEIAIGRYGSVSLIAYSRDPRLIDRLWDCGYKSDSKTYNYYEFKPMEVFGKYDFLDDYKRTIMFSEDRLNESALYEQSLDGIVYDLYSEYTEEDLLLEFLDNKEHGIKTKKWPLIPADQYKTLLQRFMSAPTPEAARIPAHVVDEWFRLCFMNAIAIEHITAFAGHSQWFPIDACECVLDPDVDWSDYEEASEYLENIGFYDWCKLPDGSDAWSDYGLGPIFGILNEYKPSQDPSETLLLINRVLDVTHCRGDLASAFIEGGSKTCSSISGILRESRKRKKTKTQHRKNDKGELVPEKCAKCGGKVGVYIQGEPIFKCSKCGVYYGTLPFPDSLDK